jgi:Na+-driven multidrug efflux pump
MYSISNVAIQSAINIFGEATIAANTAAVNMEDMIYFALNALMQSVTSFVGQNMGQRDFGRIRRVMLLGLVCVIVSAAVMCSAELIFAEQLMGIFSKSKEVIRIGVDRLYIVLTLYFLCGVQEMFIGGMRGMGTSMLPTVISLICIVGVRLSWLTFVFPHFMRPEMIYILYPMTWILATTAEGIAFLCVFRRTSRSSDRKA